MPSPRFEKLDAAKQEALLEAAREEFATHGFEASSYNRIIENSGLSKGSFYYYFHGKEDLYLTVAYDAASKFSIAVGDPLDVDSIEAFWEECHQLYHRLLRFGKKNPHLVGVLKSVFELRQGPLADDLTTRLMMVKDVEWYMRLIQRGQEVGAVRSDLPLQLLLAFVLALIQAKGRVDIGNWLSYDQDDLESHTRIMIDIFRRIATPAPPGTEPLFEPEQAESSQKG